MEFDAYHIPVMLNECIEALEIKPDGIYVDCTLGGGGHSLEILKRLKNGRLIGIDKDGEALSHCEKKFSEYLDKVTFIRDDFKNIKNILSRLNINGVDGILADYGVSSRQLDDQNRGFSYIKSAKLDMRMDTSQELTAWKVVNEYSEQKLFEIIRDYGEDRFAKNIAKNIAIARTSKTIDTTTELAEIVDKSIPYAVKKTGGHPAKRTFQAIRIEVNGELSGLKESVEAMIESLNINGKLSIITFHSLEDKIVKNVFKDKSTGCICPKSFPICVCGHVAEVEIDGKMRTASEQELATNGRSASAKLRTVRKIHK
ncbi:MAG TPA: 16S rRNA (cytosine(1402)-N(4))-methyltransferase RsmH [Clostridia bacterium]|nr:16S rRNA (cytosine(1402)-N(4))-methyltransferase RsmH [Clostridia bacterium]